MSKLTSPVREAAINQNDPALIPPAEPAPVRSIGRSVHPEIQALCTHLHMMRSWCSLERHAQCGFAASAQATCTLRTFWPSIMIGSGQVVHRCPAAPV